MLNWKLFCFVSSLKLRSALGSRWDRAAYMSKIWNLEMSKLGLFSNCRRFDLLKNGMDCLNWMFQSRFMAS